MKICKAIFCLGIFLIVANSRVYSQSQPYIDSLNRELLKFENHKKTLKQPNPSLDTIKARILAELAFEIIETNPDAALKYAEQELRLAQKINYKWGISSAYHIFGYVYDMRSDYPRALDFYYKSLKVKKLTNNKLDMIGTYMNLAVVYIKQVNYPEAHKNLSIALELAKSINNKFRILGAYNNMGLLYGTQGNYTQAIRNFMKCLQIAEEIKQPHVECVVLNNIGDCYIELGKDELAIQYLQKGLKVARKSAHNIAEANNLNTLGRVYQKLGKYNEAMRYYKASLQVTKKVDYVSSMIFSYIGIGATYHKLGNLDKAIRNINNALALAKQAGEANGITESYRHLSEIYKDQGNFKKAFENQSLLMTVKDSVFTAEKDKKLIEQQMNYNFRIIQDSVKAVQEKKDMAASEKIREEKLTRNAIFIILGIIVVFLSIVLVQYTKLAKVRRQKAIESERNRISRELHDDLGAQLSTAKIYMGRIRNQPENTPKVTEALNNSMELIDNSMADLRNILNELNGSVLAEKGYIAATEELAGTINRIHSMQFLLTHNNVGGCLSLKQEHSLYRVTQELTNNTLKYARAQTISIDLVKRNGMLVMMYEDDGIGFDFGKTMQGHGLKNIQSRIKEMNGNVAFDTQPGAGFRAIIEIPL